jgi:hypothetical protein
MSVEELAHATHIASPAGRRFMAGSSADHHISLKGTKCKYSLGADLRCRTGVGFFCSEVAGFVSAAAVVVGEAVGVGVAAVAGLVVVAGVSAGVAAVDGVSRSSPDGLVDGDCAGVGVEVAFVSGVKGVWVSAIVAGREMNVIAVAAIPRREKLRM